MQWQGMWDDVRVFLAVARAGSLSAAASELGLGVATVSRRISRLEQALAVALFSRHQNGYRLTNDGTGLLVRAEGAESAMNSLVAAGEAAGQVAGRVRLATAEYLAADILLPALPRLLQCYPSLSVDIVTDVSLANLHRRDADLAVRMVRPEHGNLRIRRLGTLGYGLYGSADYLRGLAGQAGRAGQQRTRQKRAGQENSFAGKSGQALSAWDLSERDLSSCDFVTWSESYSHLDAARWVQKILRQRTPLLTVTSMTSKIAALKAGLGLGVLPHLVAIPAGLQAVGDSSVKQALSAEVDQDIWLAIHKDLAESPRVRAVADFLAGVITDQAALLRGQPHDKASQGI